jgi:tripartite-type tricarboxylate transporter receptor subunit TctC
MPRQKRIAKIIILAMAAGLLLAPRGFAAEPFYQGKTITILEGRRAGGTGSLRVQIAAKYLQKYLPGAPAVVYQFMPGAGGVAATNHLVHTAERDGLTIANVSSGIISSLIVGSPSVRFKLEDLLFLGSATSGSPYGIVVRPGLELDTVEKFRMHKGLRFANRSVGHTMYIGDRMAAFILELKEPRWILGYSDQEIRLALERREADVMIGGIPGHVRETPEWFKQGFTVPVIVRNSVGEGAERYPGFPQGRPSVEQFVDTDLKKQVYNLYQGARVGGSNFIVHKDVPKPALAALKEAFDKVWKDPQFAAEFEQMTKQFPGPMSGDEIHKVLAQMPQDQRTIDIYKRIIGAGPLPAAE